jgi:hypothetical protein
MAAPPRTERTDIDGPRPPLVGVWSELDLDDDREDRLSVRKKEHEIGAVLGRYDLRELGGLDPNLRMGGEVDAERVREELGRERGAIAEEEEQALVKHRRHRARSLAGRLSAHLS